MTLTPHLCTVFNFCMRQDATDSFVLRELDLGTRGEAKPSAARLASAAGHAARVARLPIEAATEVLVRFVPSSPP